MGVRIFRVVPLILALLVALAACSSKTTTLSPRSAKRGEPAKVAAGDKRKGAAIHARESAPPRHAALRFELNGRPFPSPLLHGNVAGHPTWMLVDTGANSHMLAGWLARKAGLKLTRHGDVGSDHAGRPVETFRVEKPRIVVDEWGSLDQSTVLAMDVPDILERLGIGFFISPQRLLTDSAVVLDLAHGEMRESNYRDAVSALEGKGTNLTPGGGQLCLSPSNADAGIWFVIPAAVDGKKVRLLLDTGAERSDLLATSPAGKALVARSVRNQDELYAASGRVFTRTLKKVQVEVGDVRVRTDVDILPGSADPYCPRDGVMSMDVLRRCVLVLGREAMYGRCGA